MSQFDRHLGNRVPDQSSGGRSRGTAGFTLIEVLVALAIALLALGTLYRMTSTGLHAGAIAERYSRALIVAESTLESIGIGEAPPVGTFEQRIDGIYDRRVSIRGRPDLLAGGAVIPKVFPYEIAVRVGWREGGRERSIALSTLRLGQPP